MHQLTVFFLYAFLLDGLVSLIYLMTGHAAQSSPNAFVVSLSLGILLLSGFLFFAMVFTPRLSKRLVLPPILFIGFNLVWATVFGMRGALVFSMVQILLALGLMIKYRTPSGFRLQNFTQTRPAFTLRNFLLTAPLNIVIGGVILGLLTLGVAQQLRCKMVESVNGYMTVQRDGIFLEERIFRQKEKEIRLVGMMHVATSGFYNEIAETLPEGANAIVLLEGVKDRQHHLKTELDYTRLADMLGLTAQAKSSFSKKAAKGLKQARNGLEYHTSDLDVNEFKQDTRDQINALHSVLDSKTLLEALQKFMAASQTQTFDLKAIEGDILQKRNEHLLGDIRKMLESHQIVIVPWGADHLPGIQKEIESWGFAETARTQRQALPFQNKALIALISLLDRFPASAK